MSTSPRLYVFLLVVAVAWVYANALDGSFHYDDFHSLVYNPHVRDLANIPAFFADPSLFSVDVDKAMYRPLLLISYALNYAWGQYDTASYHLLNIAIHIGCVLLVWALGRRLACGEQGALLAAALFALHPLATEPVNYISSRSESLAALFLLAALYFYLGNKTWQRALSWGCCLCGVLVKSIVVVLPILLLLYDILWLKKPVRWRHHLPYWGITGLYVFIITANRFLGESVAKAPRPMFEQLLTQCKALVYYAHMIILPVKLNVEHQFAVSHGIGAATFFALLLIASACFIAVSCRQSRWLFWVAWFVVALLPTIIMPLNVLVNEHRLYLPLVALALAAGHTWEQRGGGRARIAVCILLGLCALLAYERNRVWHDELSLWSDAAAKSPQMVRPQVFLGNARREVEDYAGAKRAYETALTLDSQHRSARTNLANIYLEAAQRDSARADEYLQVAQGHYERVLAVDPGYREALNNLGSLYIERRDLERAEQVLAASIEQNANFADAYYNWGLVKAQRGDYAAAADLFQRGLALEEDAQTWYELGNARAQIGQLVEAAAAYRKALALDAGDRRSLYNLAEVLLVAGERALAAGQYELRVAMWSEAQDALLRLVALHPEHQRGSARLRQLEERLR